MPTAAKLFAAVAFAVLGFFAAEIFKPYMPEGTKFGMLSEATALIGLLCGWHIMGRSVGGGNRAAIGAGVRTSLALVFWALLIFSIEEMIVLAFRRSYDTPMQAVVGVIALMTDFGKKLLTPEMVGLLLVGGALGGMLAEWSSRRWR